MCNLATFSYQKCVILPKNDINADFLNFTQMMTEKEKCRLGMLYDANYDKELIEERQVCKDICHEYNQVKPSDLERRGEILRKLLGKTGKEFLIEQPFYCDYGYNIEIGENFYEQCELRDIGWSQGEVWRQCFRGSQLWILYRRASARCEAENGRIGICQTYHHRK